MTTDAPERIWASVVGLEDPLPERMIEAWSYDKDEALREPGEPSGVLYRPYFSESHLLSEEAVERAARALYADMPMDACDDEGGGDVIAWEDLPEHDLGLSIQTDCLRQARAALEAALKGE
jgi:hypothetical protein